MSMQNSPNSIEISIAWCLAWGSGREPLFDLSVLRQMRSALNSGEEVPQDVREIVDGVRELQELPFPHRIEERSTDS
ncbi:MAG TPA: hypothetical protein DCS91_13745 [Microcoleaceae bacterium UBA11344]|nr:hypothetical protein [Microcoleaceae cyanobacterium UBA11344]